MVLFKYVLPRLGVLMLICQFSPLSPLLLGAASTFSFMFMDSSGCGVVLARSIRMWSVIACRFDPVTFCDSVKAD